MTDTPSFFEDTRLFRLIVEVSPSGKVIVDRAGIIVYINPQALDWLGYEEGELLGKHVEVLVPDVHRDKHGKLHSRYMRSPKARPMAAERSLFAQRKNGNAFPVDISLHPFQSQNNQFVLANLVDATLREEAERVPQERLAAIGEMVAGLAHESRNALQRARACLDLLELDLQDNCEQLDFVVRIRKSLEDLEHNYDEVRNYAAPIVIEASNVDVPNLIDEVLEDLKAELTDHQIILKVTTAPEAAINRLDRYRIKQVFRNVLENAIQASPTNSHITCCIRLEKEVDRNWQIIDVTDQGEGIAEANATRIFEPFFTTKSSGTGLGLAICRRNLDAHHGTISLVRNEHQGTTIRIMLPLVTARS